MIQLTQKGKEVYGWLDFTDTKVSIDWKANETLFTIAGGFVLAHGWLELKALLDMNLIEIK